MQTALITGGEETARQQKALQMAKVLYASREDTIILKPSKDTSIIRINEVRELKRKLALKPFNSPAKVAVIYEAQKATLEAQNALLKILEEPPDNTYIILTAPRAGGLLPTIISRCQIIKITNYELRITNYELQSNLQLLTSIFQSEVGERLVYANKISKDKETAIEWCQKIIIALREILLNSYSRAAPASLQGQPLRKANLLRKLQKALTVLETTNTNIRLLIENLLLEFPKQKC